MPKLRVYGEILLKVDFDIELDMTESEFEDYSDKAQEAIIERNVNWRELLESAETHEIEVFEFREVEQKIDG